MKCLGCAGLGWTGEGVSSEIFAHTGGEGVSPGPEQYWAASVLGAEDLLVGGHHFAIVHIHDLSADLAAGRGHWGRGKEDVSRSG